MKLFLLDTAKSFKCILHLHSSLVYKINTCYILRATYFQIPVEKRKIERERESTAGGFLVSALCALAWLGPSYASVPRRASALHRQTNTHTHSQLGLPVIRQQEDRAKYTLSQNHAFINTFTHPKRSFLQHITEWHGCERLDSLKCCIKGTEKKKYIGFVMRCLSFLCQVLIEYINFIELN